MSSAENAESSESPESSEHSEHFTERLHLRTFRESDLDAYAAMMGDPEVMRFMRSGPVGRADAWRHIAMLLGHWQLRGYGAWAVVERATETLVGRVGFHNPDGWPGFELGWLLGRSAWGRGYAIEAARAALDHAFGPLGRDHVVSLIHPDNARSIRVAERLGERLEGRTRLPGGLEVLVYGIRRGEGGAARGGQEGTATGLP